jgi:glycosyltransferase involved in cell wall biosynthesis
MAQTTRSLVIPVYRNEASITDLIRTVRQLAADRRAGAFEAIFVVDGSPDQSCARLREQLPGAGFESRLIVLSRNFGSFAAIRAGLVAARGDSCAVLAADLQEPPELILEMYRQLESGQVDVVVGRRSHREDPFLARLFSSVFWFVYRRIVEPGMPPGGVDVFACNLAFRKVLVAMEESHSSLIGLLFWMGFRRGEAVYAREARQHGKSAWSFQRKLRYLSDSLFSFTDLPIRILLIGGLCGVTASVVFGAVALTGRLLGWISVPGYTATVLTILFFGALTQLGLGIVGSYTWRAFENTKRRPGAIVMWQESFPGSPDLPKTPHG